MSAPGNERQDVRAARWFATFGAWFMGCGLAMIVGGLAWQRALVLGAVFYAYLGGRLVS